MASGGGTNVKVAVRSRPLNKKEKSMKCKLCVTMAGATTKIKEPATSASAKRKARRGAAANEEHEFAYDYSYWLDTAQSQVYEDMGKPIVEKAIEGFNGTVFAYGQTGSGKTYSMLGSDDDPGVIPLMNARLFELLDEAKAADESRNFLVTVSYLEIYNEVIKDLLNPSEVQLKIREHPKMGIYVDNLATLVVTTAQQVGELLEQGSAVRQVAATQMNERSSRSHSCFIVSVQQKSEEDLGGGVTRHTTLSAKVNLVDLAGSERATKTGATGQRLKEGAAINLSLTNLGTVINALASGKAKHIPYRNSKLTRLLQESLGGNALTAMIATLSPADYNYSESLSTLKYASRAKTIKNQAKRNEDVNERMIRKLREEIEQLRRQMAEMAAKGHAAGEGPISSAGDDEKTRRMEEMIANLERAKNQNWSEVERISEMYNEERARNLENENKVRSVMQTMKEENMELMKRLRALQQEKLALNRTFKRQREEYTSIKTQLELSMRQYQDLMDSGDGDDEERLSALLEEIERQRQQLLGRREALNKTKESMKRNDTKQTEERAEMAAQRMVLQQDHELRQAIQEEERAKILHNMDEELEKAKASYLESALDEERRRLQQEASEQLTKQYQQTQQMARNVHGRERELQMKIMDDEMQLLQAQADKNLLVLELEATQKQHTAKIDALQRKHQTELAEMSRKQKALFEGLVEGFEEEMKTLRERCGESERLLMRATADIVCLNERNQELQQQLQKALLYE